jgi:hypothetical protein
MAVSSTAPSEEPVRLSTEWIPAITAAFKDFRGKMPDRWKCYGTSTSERGNDLMIVFGSPLSTPAEQRGQIQYFGDTNPCGLTLIYTVSKSGKIKRISGIR